MIKRSFATIETYKRYYLPAHERHEYLRQMATGGVKNPHVNAELQTMIYTELFGLTRRQFNELVRGDNINYLKTIPTMLNLIGLQILIDVEEKIIDAFSVRDEIEEGSDLAVWQSTEYFEYVDLQRLYTVTQIEAADACASALDAGYNSWNTEVGVRVYPLDVVV